MNEDYILVSYKVDRLFEKKKSAKEEKIDIINREDLCCQVEIHEGSKDTKVENIEEENDECCRDGFSESDKEEIVALPPKAEKEVFDLYEYERVKHIKKKKFDWREACFSY